MTDQIVGIIVRFLTSAAGMFTALVIWNSIERRRGKRRGEDGDGVTPSQGGQAHRQ